MSRCIVIFIEGETEKKFYDRIIESLRGKCSENRLPVDKVIIKNVKGISNYQNKVQRIFLKQIIPENRGFDFDVVLCYDTDVFELNQNPPVNWKKVEKMLEEMGARSVTHVKAKKCIEDWFLKDLEGICHNLGIRSNQKLVGKNGVKKLESLFKKGNKIYIKGNETKNFVSSLSMQKIMREICSDLKPLCKIIGINCSNKKC